MELYNIMTAQGPGWDGSIMGGASQCWLVLLFLIILDLVLRRQCEDGIFQGVSFNFIGASVLGALSWIVVVTITGAPKWSLLAGIVGIAVGGFALGLIFPDVADSGGGSGDGGSS